MLLFSFFIYIFNIFSSDKYKIESHLVDSDSYNGVPQKEKKKIPTIENIYAIILFHVNVMSICICCSAFLLIEMNVQFPKKKKISCQFVTLVLHVNLGLARGRFGTTSKYVNKVLRLNITRINLINVCRSLRVGIGV